ncbi:MAG: NADH-quinone oxidoreductase subunit L [Bacteroidales bacterium]
MVKFQTLAYFSWLVPLFPLAGFLINSLAHRKLKGITGGVTASAAVGLSFLFTVALFFFQKDAAHPSFLLDLGNWIIVGKFSVPFEFLIDPLSVTMMLIVTGVGLLIHIYSIGYMRDDERFNAFFSQMNLFTFSMLLLVMGANYLILFIGWEGVGLCSYLLIGFWFKNPEYNLAARKAFIMNRIGDLGFLLGIFLIFFTYQSLSFQDIFPKLTRLDEGSTRLTLITIFLLIGALGKSAQIPLFTWLPDAMAGPTPVSALIHAATMVTAGIYMIARSSGLFMLAPITMGIIVAIGLATALIAASIGLYQNDIKKVLAYSTVSQLGYMFLALGVGAFSSAVFHLTTHAFFKALLFLGAGSVIHALQGEQDIRKMGGLRKSMPWTYWTFLIATLAISGIPPFSGFFSKDEILLQAYMAHPMIYLAALFGALLTCFYMFRLIFLVFYGDIRGNTSVHLHESPKVMTIPLAVLAFLSLFGGFINLPALLGGGEGFKHFLSPAIFVEHTHGHLISHIVELMLLLFSLSLLVITIYLAWFIFIKRHRIPGPDGLIMPWYRKLVFRKYYVDELYNMLFVKPFEFLSAFFYDKIEKGIIDKIVNLTGNLTFEIGVLVRKLQNGSISFYLFSMMAGLLFFLLLNLFIA